MKHKATIIAMMAIILLASCNRNKTDETATNRYTHRNGDAYTKMLTDYILQNINSSQDSNSSG